MPPWKALVLNTLAGAAQGLGFLAAPWRLMQRAGALGTLRRRLRHPVPASTQFDGGIKVVGSGEIVLGEYCRFGSSVILETRQAGRIVLGSHVRLNQGCVVAACRLVSIGDDTLVGEYASIRDANHGLSAGQLIRLQRHAGAEVRIGRDVWIGRGACILPGVEIGDGAVIGANSLVSRSIPAGAVAVGNPAKVIKYREAMV